MLTVKFQFYFILKFLNGQDSKYSLQKNFNHATSFRNSREEETKW